MNKINIIESKARKINTRLLTTNIDLSQYKDKNILTFGTFDLLHEGHLKIIRHAVSISGNEKNIFIGISSDKWNGLKGKKSMQSEEARIEKIREIFPNINTFLEDHKLPEETWPQHWDDFNIDLIIMGGDHIGSLSYINETFTEKGKKMKIVFFERTPNISSSKLREFINDKNI